MTFNTFFLIRLLLLRYIIIEPLVSMYIYSAVYVPLHLYACFQLPKVVNLALVHARYDREFMSLHSNVGQGRILWSSAAEPRVSSSTSNNSKAKKKILIYANVIQGEDDCYKWWLDGGVLCVGWSKNINNRDTYVEESPHQKAYYEAWAPRKWKKKIISVCQMQFVRYSRAVIFKYWISTHL